MLRFKLRSTDCFVRIKTQSWLEVTVCKRKKIIESQKFRLVKNILRSICIYSKYLPKSICIRFSIYNKNSFFLTHTRLTNTYEHFSLIRDFNISHFLLTTLTNKPIPFTSLTHFYIDLTLTNTKSLFVISLHFKNDMTD